MLNFIERFCPQLLRAGSPLSHDTVDVERAAAQSLESAGIATSELMQQHRQIRQFAVGVVSDHLPTRPANQHRATVGSELDGERAAIQWIFVGVVDVVSGRVVELRALPGGTLAMPFAGGAANLVALSSNGWCASIAAALDGANGLVLAVGDVDGQLG